MKCSVNISILLGKSIYPQEQDPIYFILFVQWINLYNDPMQGLIRHQMQFKPVDIL